MNSVSFPAWLLPYGPLVPLESLVEQINNIYHSFDAGNYDAEHREIILLWPGLWRQMMRQLPERKCWRVLDFGCGTGFAAEQLLQTLGPNIDVLMAYDPSPEMLDQSRLRLQDSRKVIFSDKLPLVGEHGPYNLLITNSVLHHMADIQRAVSNLNADLSDDAYWLAGNEPSVSFYKNDECIHLFEEYSRYRRRIKWLEPSSYTAKLRKMLGRHTLSATARASVARGLFARRPSHAVIDWLVDFHVAHSVDEVTAGRGLDLAKMQTAFTPQWKLLWSTTYSFLGFFSEMTAPQKWRDKAGLLKDRFPSDGANFCAVWSRPAQDRTQS